MRRDRAALIDRQLAVGYISPGWDRDFKLTAVEDDEGNMRAPNVLELTEWYSDTFVSEHKVNRFTFTLLSEIAFCGQCAKRSLAVEADFLCIRCRFPEYKISDLQVNTALYKINNPDPTPRDDPRRD